MTRVLWSDIRRLAEFYEPIQMALAHYNAELQAYAATPEIATIHADMDAALAIIDEETAWRSFGAAIRQRATGSEIAARTRLIAAEDALFAAARRALETEKIIAPDPPAEEEDVPL
jgi:hypothetical protein